MSGQRLHFEDFGAGDAFDLGERELSEAEIIAFAREWDPQYFHVDPVAATQSMFGGLIASGWHSAVVWMRMYADGVLNRSAGMGGGGVQELRWLVPTRPGDRLRGRVLILGTEPSASRPAWGKVSFQGELWNQRDELAMRLLGTGFFARRDAAG